MTDGDDNLWSKMPGESSRAYAAFCAYRDMGPSSRGLRKVAATLGKAREPVESWSVRWSWVSRVEAYDRHQDQCRQAALEQQRREADARHVQAARALQFKAIERLATLEPAELKPSELLDYLVQAIKLERLALGAAIKVVEERQVSNVASTAQTAPVLAGPLVPVLKGATVEELKNLRDLVAPIAARQGGSAADTSPDDDNEPSAVSDR